MAKIDFDALYFRKDTYPHLPGAGTNSKLPNEKYAITRDEGSAFYVLTNRESGIVYEVSVDLVSTAQRSAPTPAVKK